MSRDPLRESIETALLGHIDSGLFEECAVSLLRHEVPSLVLLPGGDDHGLDGISIDGEWGLVATVGAALSNLKKNLTRHLNTGGSTRRILFATPRRLTNAQRRNLVAAASKLGFDLTLGQVYEQKAFTERLYRDSAWRTQLLGIPGAPPALSDYPMSLRATMDVPLVGRVSELSRLKSASGDVLIVGEPGTGKTHLTQALVSEGRALFVIDFDRERLTDAIRDLSPQRIVIEDVHFQGTEAFAEMAYLRRTVGGNFSIVWTTWPAHAAEWEILTQATTIIRLEPLTRDEMVEVVRRAGVSGPNQLVRLIVDQSLGRPGLAVMLARACRSGRVVDVARGEVLMAEMALTYRRLLDARAIDVLSVLAVAGEHGGTPEEVAKALNLDLATTRQLIRGLAHGGALEQRRDRRLIVLPRDLRYPLVRDAFLADVVTLPLTSILSTLDKPTSALQPLIGAMRLGAIVKPELIEALLEASSDADDFAMYASLGEREAIRSLKIAPMLRRRIALAAIGPAPKFGVTILLDDAVGDHRPRHSNPDHSMRELRDFVTSPHSGIAERQMVMEAVEEWIDSGKDHDVALEAMCLILRPAWEGRETDPGRGMTVTLSAGLVSLADLRALSSLVKRVISRVCGMRPVSYEHLVEMLHEWCFPTGLTFGQASADTAWRRLARTTVRESIEEIASCMPDRIAVISRLARTARSAGLTVKVQSLDEFEALFPSDDVRGDWQASERRQVRSAIRLARKWQTYSVNKFSDRLCFYEEEARAAGLNYPRLSPNVCAFLADKAAHRLSYVRALSARDASSDLVAPFLEIAVLRRDRAVIQTIRRLMRHPNYQHLAIVMALRHDSLPLDLMNAAVAACDETQKNALEAFALRNELRHTSLVPLLEHPNVVVARSVAIGMRDSVPASLRQLWEETIVRCPADEYWYSVILKNDPALFGRWLVAFCARDRVDKPGFEHIPHTLSEAIKELSQDDRLMVLRTMPSSPRNPWLDRVIRQIVGDDARVFDQLLRRPDLKAFHSDGLAGRVSEAWFERADVALRHGWAPERVASAIAMSEHSWMGDESAHWQSRLDEFEAYLANASVDRRKVIEAALAQFRRMRDTALKDEHREAVTGMP